MPEGVAYNGLGRYADAVEALKRSDQNNPWVHVNLVYAYSELGRQQDARAEAAEVLRISPGFSLEEVERMPGNWHGPLGQRYLSDLRKAGLKCSSRAFVCRPTKVGSRITLPRVLGEGWGGGLEAVKKF